MPSQRRSIVTLAALATLSLAWFSLQPDAVPLGSGVDVTASESESQAIRTAVDPQRAVVAPDVQSAGLVGTDMTAAEMPLKIDLATTGWCWVVAESDGERALYGLIEPGKRVVLEAQRRISLRLGDAGSVRLSVNDGPSYTPGLDGEVVELEVTPEDVERLRGGVVGSGSAMLRRSEFTS